MGLLSHYSLSSMAKRKRCRCRCSEFISGDSGDEENKSENDNISKLPESVIGHILSRLTISEALETSTLSKDWKYKWTNIYTFKVSDAAIVNRGNEFMFVNFMDRMLHLLFSYNMRSFQLYCTGKYDSTRLTQWILPILGPNLETFNLYHDHKGFVIPQALLNCTSLRFLRMSFGCTFRVPTMCTFPCLMKLNLNGVEILNENPNTDTMILDFPVLKKFILVQSKWLNVKFVEIRAPTLDKFISYTSSDEPLNDYSIKIFGTRPFEFHILGGLQNRFVLNGSTIARAQLLCFPLVTEDSILQVRRLFDELSNMRQLHIGGSLVKDLAKQNFEFPRYDKLEVMVIRCGGDVSVLVKLLRAAPYLKILRIDAKGWVNIDDKLVGNAPYCMVSSLEEVKFAYSSSSYMPEEGHEFRIESLILKIASRLKTVRILVGMVYEVSQCEEIFRKLLTLPTASASLNVVIG